jgi:acyl-coenzyme A synthetase/AMP-(fatty) acid ligase/thioesterase domain-containing protein
MSAAGHDVTRAVRPISPDDIDSGVIGRFHTVVHAQADATAVDDGDRSHSFASLAARVAAVRQQILDDVGRAPGQPVALLYSHTADAVAALFGIIATGHPVLVLDPRTPAPRLTAFADRVGARLVFTDSVCKSAAAQVAQRVLLDASDTLDASGPEAAARLASLWEEQPAPGAPAALAFTSGSTGQPKVVINDHRMLVRDAWVNSVGTGCYGAGDVVAHTLPLAFHAGLMATVAGVLAGATMRLYDVRSRGIASLPAWMASQGITIAQASPAILRALVGTGPAPADLAGLRSLTIAGEAAYGPDIEAARQLLPATCVLRNRYGSSETGLIAEYQVQAAHPPIAGALPVGFGVGDTVIGLVDEAGHPVAPGEPGIITITSPALAQGYHEDPDATSAVFSANPDGTRTYRSNDLGVLGSSGELQLLGRRDHSVKIRGYLVEPGEIDAVLFAMPEVREALTVGVPRADQAGMRLVSYVVSSADRPSATSIRGALHTSLPSHMVPETIVFLDALPRTDRGKLDRAGLPEPPAVVPGSTGGPLSEWEQVVQAVWCAVLALPDIGRDDDFFELGGDSLAAEALMAIMTNELGVPKADATTSNLVQAPTLAAFASRLKRLPAQENPSLVPLRTTGTRPPLFIATGGGGLGVGMVPIMRHLDPDLPVYALQAHGLESRGIPDWTVAASARRHVASVRSIQPEGPYVLAGHSFGGIIAFEMAQQLRRAGQDVALLVVMDSFPPDGKFHAPEEDRTFTQRVKDAIGVAATGVRGTPGEDQYWRFWRQSNVLHRMYRGTPWDGETLVLVAETPEREERTGWAPYLTGSWRLEDIPGDHISMLRDPYARRTAELIGQAVRQAQHLSA